MEKKHTCKNMRSGSVYVSVHVCWNKYDLRGILYFYE